MDANKIITAYEVLVCWEVHKSSTFDENYFSIYQQHSVALGCWQQIVVLPADCFEF